MSDFRDKQMDSMNELMHAVRESYDVPSLWKELEQLHQLCREQHEALINAKSHCFAWQGPIGDDIHKSVMKQILLSMEKYNLVMKS